MEVGSLGTAHPSQEDKCEADRKGQEVWEEVGRELALSCHPDPVVRLAPPPTLPWEWLGLKVVIPKTAIRGPELAQGLTPSRGAQLGLKGEAICPTWAQGKVGGCWVQRELPCGLPGPIRTSLQAL